MAQPLPKFLVRLLVVVLGGACFSLVSCVSTVPTQPAVVELTPGSHEPAPIAAEPGQAVVNPESRPPSTLSVAAQETTVTPSSRSPGPLRVAVASASQTPFSREPLPQTIRTKTATAQPASYAPSQKAPIQVSQEVYDRTFKDVQDLINTLNQVIRNKDYDTWVGYLTDDFRRYMSGPDVLRALSESPVLVKNGISLKSLQDYFGYVVVPSRANLRLDELVFLTETEVEAIMKVGDRRVTLYRLIKVGDQWKIGLS